MIHDRDANAACNILVAAGLAETQNACGGYGSPGAALAVASEAGTHRGTA
jgi:putative transposase